MLLVIYISIDGQNAKSTDVFAFYLEYSSTQHDAEFGVHRGTSERSPADVKNEAERGL